MTVCFRRKQYLLAAAACRLPVDGSPLLRQAPLSLPFFQLVCSRSLHNFCNRNPTSKFWLTVYSLGEAESVCSLLLLAAATSEPLTLPFLQQVCSQSMRDLCNCKCTRAWRWCIVELVLLLHRSPPPPPPLPALHLLAARMQPTTCPMSSPRSAPKALRGLYACLATAPFPNLPPLFVLPPQGCNQVPASRCHCRKA